MWNLRLYLRLHFFKVIVNMKKPHFSVTTYKPTMLCIERHVLFKSIVTSLCLHLSHSANLLTVMTPQVL